jgi:LAO/AO transport system kinase
LGVTGVPGAGKSTLIDALGQLALAHGRKVGVLAIDPSSRLSGGSVLGDRTRMAALSRSPEAFVRPSPSAGKPGGIGPRSREALVVLEAAGYDFLIVETVGSGQAELEVTDAVDLLLAVLLAGAGDEVQGLKRGLLEHADLVVFNKADGERSLAADSARDELDGLLRHVRREAPEVLSVSALEGKHVEALYSSIEARFSGLRESGALEQRRRHQRRAWLRSALESAWLLRLSETEATKTRLEALRGAVERGEIAPYVAAQRLLAPSD